MRLEAALLCALAAAALVEGSHKIMSDVTLGFGQALEHCREEVSTNIEVLKVGQ